jgi:diaminohydroxyphosphoribosylaminopyrimidine deaminase/5-amino-6-(5-phosphoribosylamino)uracil reductase
MEYMRRALALARKAVGSTLPNPAVGAVVVKDGHVVGEGYTQPPPGPHAEAVALGQAGLAARGAGVYVSLEPCCPPKAGRTPPCTDAVIAAGVAEVHVAILDPDPQVNGEGLRRLREAGLTVHLGQREAEARRLLEGYIKHRTTGLPFVIGKFAASLDGRIAAASGDSRWIAGPEARRWAHRLRTQVDAIAVGSTTVVVDDPLLTARPRDRPAARQPLRIVVDTRGRTSPLAQVLAGPAPTLIACAGDVSPAWRTAIEATGAEVLATPKEGEHVDLLALLTALAQRGVLSLLVEGGGVLLGGFFDRGLVDKVHAVIARMVMGAAGAPAAVAGRGAYRMSDALRLHEATVQRLGEDILVTGYPQYRELVE